MQLGRRLLGVGAALVTVAGCSGVAGPPSVVYPSASPGTSAAASPIVSPSPAGPKTFTSSSFDQPFTITLPEGWQIGDQAPDMAAFYLPMGPDQGPREGIDIQEVPQVFEDPCAHQPERLDPGATPAALATWMGTWEPLHASKPVAATVSGLQAISVDEAFSGTPACTDANLWPTSGGYLDPAEHKRYAILEVGGKRVVVTLVGRDDTWDATLADAQSVLDSLTFTDP